MCGKTRERVAVPSARSFDAAQCAELILLVGDAESLFESDVAAQFAKQVGAECVDRAARDLVSGVAEPVLEPVRDFARGFVREGERADAFGREPVRLDQIADAFGETERLARARSREHEEWSRFRLDRGTLRWRRCNRRGLDATPPSWRRACARASRAIRSRSLIRRRRWGRSGAS